MYTFQENNESFNKLYKVKSSFKFVCIIDENVIRTGQSSSDHYSDYLHQNKEI